MSSAVTLVTDQSLGVAPAPGHVVLERTRARREWRDLRLDAALERMAGVPGHVIVLARQPSADPGASGLADIATAFGADLVLLPDEPAPAALVVAVGRRCAAMGVHGLAPRLWALAGALGGPCGSTPVSPLGARTLAAWVHRAARPCGWCRHGREVPGGTCGRCGART